MEGAAIEWITSRIVAALEREEPVGAEALTFLLRRYGATGRDELGDALGSALGRALEESRAGDSTDERAAWLRLFAEAAAASEDGRIQHAACELASGLRGEWGRTRDVAAAVRSVDACLIASELVDPRAFVPPAIDELERVVGAAYRPGEGLAQTLGDEGRGRGHLDDHVAAAAALLNAYRKTARIQYPMLAEELMQFARRTLWDEARGGFSASPDSGEKPFAVNCTATGVLCALEELHREPEYREAAVTAAGADYAGDAAQILGLYADTYRNYGLKAAVYGIVLGEWLTRSW